MAQENIAKKVIESVMRMIRNGETDRAHALVDDLIAQDDSIPLRLLQCEILLAENRTDAALACLNVAEKTLGPHASLCLRIAQIQLNLRQRDLALSSVEKAAAIAVDDGSLLNAIAQIFIQLNQPELAKPILIKANISNPRDPVILFDHALCRYYLNEMDEAENLLNQLLALRCFNGGAIHLRSTLRTWTQAKNNVNQIRTWVNAHEFPSEHKIGAYFALAKELEDIGEFAQSFEALNKGAKLQRSRLNYNVKTDIDAMQAVSNKFDRNALDVIKEGCQNEGPIFIVGLPRTGTTLVERILSYGNNVVPVGEVTDFPFEMAASARVAAKRNGILTDSLLDASLLIDFDELGQNYLRSVRQLTNNTHYFIDKLPFNFRYCGLIKKALPNAKIIHLSRNPMDTCYAIYKTLFYQVYHFSYDLNELAQFYLSYRRTMEHWNAVLPGQILNVRYEDLVTDFSVQSNRILDWCGLQWSPDIVNFHSSTASSTTASAAQIRKPIYNSSVNKWRNFESQLESLKQFFIANKLVHDNGEPIC